MADISGDSEKIGAIIEQVFDLQALVRGAVRTGEYITDDPDIGKLGLEFLAVMSILSHVETRFEDLTEQLGFDRAA